ncbi:hypothetical protein K438DRAFT_1963804 [Mycena galopus ATCC 62051]|nr:hypothetical protein K438DRAFT_1963804 [Mycena galopus ATCC 62051]
MGSGMHKMDDAAHPAGEMALLSDRSGTQEDVGTERAPPLTSWACQREGLAHTKAHDPRPRSTRKVNLDGAWRGGHARLVVGVGAGVICLNRYRDETRQASATLPRLASLSGPHRPLLSWAPSLPGLPRPLFSPQLASLALPPSASPLLPIPGSRSYLTTRSVTSGRDPVERAYVYFDADECFGQTSGMLVDAATNAVRRNGLEDGFTLGAATRNMVALIAPS